jgi:hypothetical protein
MVLAVDPRKLIVAVVLLTLTSIVAVALDCISQSAH